MDRMTRPLRVGISGSYGGLNLGDEAILQSIIHQLRHSLPVEITVFSRNPDDTLRRHGVERAIPVRRLARDEVRPELERLDLLIIGGGGILFDAEAKVFLREAQLARELGLPVMVYAIGAGPLDDPATQHVVRDVLSAVQVVTVRERGIRQLLEEIGVKREILVTADPALLMQPEPLPEAALRREGLDGKRRLVAMSVREPGVAAPDLSPEKYHALLANAADFIVDRLDAEVVFIPMERQVLDVQHAHAVVSQMLRPQHAAVLKGEYTAGQILGLLSAFEFAVGMRLHFLLFAALQNVPFVALSYAPKVGGFIEDLGMVMPPLRQVDAGRLIAHIDQSWDHRRELRRQISRALPRLLNAARENNRIAVEMLTHAAAERRRQ
jgi:polysaccharide pyruvyl transferase CsaB